MLHGVLGMDVMLLQEDSFSSDVAVVLTTHERFAYFSAAFQGEVDARFNPKKDPALDDLLHNIIVAGGRTVIIDEDYFMSCDDLVHGLERFVDAEPHPDRLNIIVVCSRRLAGDCLLAYLVMYCGINNIVFDKQGTDLTVSLAALLKQNQSRYDTRELVERFNWSSFWQKDRNVVDLNSELPSLSDGYASPSEKNSDYQEQKSQEMIIDTGDARKICIQFEIRTI